MVASVVLDTMDGLWSGMVELFGPAAPIYAVAVVGLIVAALAAPIVLRRPKDPLDRFDFRDQRLAADLAPLRVDRDDGSLIGLAGLLEPRDRDELSETRKLLRAAGYRGGSAVRIYHFARAVLALAMLAIGLIVFLLVPSEPDMVLGLAFSGFFALFGYFIPIYWVNRQVQARRQEIANTFPDAMDMLLVCIEGGQSLDQAMARVGREMQLSSGPLAEELLIVSQEFRAGKERAAVLRDFAQRCDVTDISAFATVLIQSAAFGTSVAQALRVYAAEMRDKRLLRAEEKANVLPTKLTLGTMLFTVPPLILILVGPSVLQILRSLAGLGQQ